MRFLALTSLAAIFAQVPAHAQNNQVLRGPAPEWVVPSELMPVPDNPTGLVFVRRQDFAVHLDAQGQAQYLGYRLKLLHPNALQLGNLSIAWNPAYGAPTVHGIRVYRDGEMIDVLAKASFEILRREDQLEAASLNGILTAVLRVADLRVGDELEVAMTTRSNNATLGRNDAGVLMILPAPSPGRFHLALSWDADRKPAVKMTPDIAPIVQRRDGEVQFSVDNPRMLAPPKSAPSRYRWQRVLEYSNFADWADISRRFTPLFAKAAKLADASPLKREASRIAAAHARPLDRAAAALKLVQQDVRYVYVGLDGGNLIPAGADETWQRRYGDCKGKTALLLALLNELGIEAEAVLVNNSGLDDGLDERLPSPYMFDHVLVRARIDGVTYWLDGTMPPVVSPSATPAMPYEWVLPLTAQGASIEHLPWQPDKRPDELHLYEIDARAGFDQPARITTTTILRGVEGLKQQIQFSGVAADQLLDAMRQRLVGDIWQAIDEVKWHYDPKAQASVMRISGTGTVDWDDDGSGAWSLALPGGGFNPPDKRARAADQNQDAPYYNEPGFNCYVTTVRLPSATKPAQWSSKPSFDQRIFGRNYYRAFDLRDGAIRMVRGSRVERREIDAATARQDNGRVASFDNSMGWIFYNPGRQRGSSFGGKVVPATYEIDWTADDVPCLSPATVR